MTRDTVLCISVSARPGQLGTAVHNAGYAALSLDYVYKACATTDIAAAMAGVRALGIRGCSVSMPFKETVIQYLDAIDDRARQIGAVNTVVNDNGRLTGYNTDVDGAISALNAVKAVPADAVLLLGAGGMGRAFACALNRRGLVPIVCSRDPARARRLVEDLSGRPVSWDHRESVRADIVINATPLGMSRADESPVDAVLDRCRAGIDAVVSGEETAFVHELIRRGVQVVVGTEIGLYQAAAQFVRYTGLPAPLAEMRSALLQATRPR